MKKTTTLSLKTQITRYGSLAAAIVGITKANSQVTYVDVIPDFSGGAPDYFAMDVNKDGVVDFEIWQSLCNCPYGNFQVLNIAPYNINNAILGSAPGLNFAYPWALSSGFTISAGNSSGNVSSAFWFNWGYSAGYQSLNYGGNFGNWKNVNDRFLGLRFDISGSTHYGWARLDVNSDGTSWTVKDYAYEATADTPIITPDPSTLSIKNELFNDIKIITRQKSIAMYNLSEPTEYKILNITGQEILKGATSNKTYVIEATTLASGVYIAELTDLNSKAVIRKKIVLQ